MAHLVYEGLVTEEAGFRLLLSPAAPALEGVTPATDLRGIGKGRLVLDPILPAFTEASPAPEVLTLTITPETRDSEAGDWEEAQPIIFGGEDAAPIRHLRRDGPFLKPADERLVLEPAPGFPDNLVGVELLLSARFIRFRWTWAPSAFPLLIGLQLQSLRRGARPELEVA